MKILIKTCYSVYGDGRKAKHVNASAKDSTMRGEK